MVNPTVNSKILIFEIIKLYKLMSGKDITLDILEEAFYELQDIVEIRASVKLGYDFNEEIEDFLDTFFDIFSEIDGYICLNDENANLEDIRQYVLESLGTSLNYICYNVEIYIHNICIFKILDLSIPEEETKFYFEINRQIVKNYLLLATDPQNKQIITQIQKLNALLRKVLSKASKLIIHKLLMVCCSNNDKYLICTDKDYDNNPWYIILFATDRLESILYDKIECFADPELNYQADEISDEEEEFEDEESIDSSILESDGFGFDDLDDVTIFMSIFILYLNKYIKIMDDSDIKADLLLKRNLFFALNQFEYFENYFLENGSIDDLTIPPYNKEWFTNDLFTMFYEVIKDNLKYIYNNNKDRQERLIIILLLIKTYLNLSVDEVKKNTLLIFLTNPLYYKTPDYAKVSSLIDDIIFSDKIQVRKREK